MENVQPAPASPDNFRLAMRQLGGGICVITAADQGVRTGMTVTSVISVALDPPELLVSINQTASSWPLIQASHCFGVNVLASHQEAVARRFAGQDGAQGEQRYAGATWCCTPDGVWLLDDALAAIACEVVACHSHSGYALVVGRASGLLVQSPDAGPLLYWQGDYRQLSFPVGN
ncbi:MAG: flavin reductase family protein [Sterolibacterium sp.]